MTTAKRYTPIVPNISDHTMRDMAFETPAVPSKHVSEPEPIQGGNTPEITKKQPNGSVGRIVIIGTIVAIITILAIILVYQIYKHFTEGDQVKSTGNINARGGNPPITRRAGVAPKIVKQRKRSAKPANSQGSGGFMPSIPEDVRELDDDILSQFITKTSNSDGKEQLPTTREMQQAVAEAQFEVDVPAVEDVSDDQLFDDDQYAEQLKEDALAQMKNDIINETSATQTQFNMADEVTDVLNSMNADDIADPVADYFNEKTVSGCEFIITRGSRKGSPCGKDLYAGDRCRSHQDK
jgi:hypothetical protein